MSANPSSSCELLSNTVPYLLGKSVGACLVVACQHRGNRCGLGGNICVVKDPVGRDDLHGRAALGGDSGLAVGIVTWDDNLVLDY